MSHWQNDKNVVKLRKKELQTKTKKYQVIDPNEKNVWTKFKVTFDLSFFSLFLFLFLSITLSFLSFFSLSFFPLFTFPHKFLFSLSFIHLPTLLPFLFLSHAVHVFLSFLFLDAEIFKSGKIAFHACKTGVTQSSYTTKQ